MAVDEKFDLVHDGFVLFGGGDEVEIFEEGLALSFGFEVGRRHGHV